MAALSDLFLTSTGRIGRLGFLFGAGALVALWAAFDLAAPGAIHRIAVWIVAPALLFSGACVLSQRLHDIGRSGWWCWPILLAFVLAWPQPDGPMSITAALVLAPAALALLILPGAKGVNRHGPPA